MPEVSSSETAAWLAALRAELTRRELYDYAVWRRVLWSLIGPVPAGLFLPRCLTQILLQREKESIMQPPFLRQNATTGPVTRRGLLCV